MRLINDAGIDAVHHDDETLTADDGGVFDLPDTLGRHLLDFPALGWREATDDDTDDTDTDDDDAAPAPRRRASRRRTS